MATRKVLIADPELEAVRPLSKALRQRGYQVAHAPDGSRALEVAVLRHPDAVLFDERCPLIEARSFVQILESNPRTADIPVLLTTARVDPDRARLFKDGVLHKPFNVDEVLARVDQLCRRAEAARELKGDNREIEGALAQLPLPDLMQILSMNRRTGRLALVHGNQRGEVSLREGRPVSARFGEVEGEKALFRLLSFQEGAFSFAPGAAAGRVQIDRSMEDALLEGARQSDERARLWAELPPPATRVVQAPHQPPLVDPHPVTDEVDKLLVQPRRVQDLLDLAQAPDLEVLTALKALLEKGRVVVREGEDPAERPLLTAAEVHALRGRILHGRPVRTATVAKVLLCCSGARGGRLVLQGLPHLAAVASEPGCLQSGFGTLGRVEVSETLKVDLVLLPTADAARPLWKPFAAGAVGGLLLEDDEAALRLARHLAFELRLPVVVAGGSASGGLFGSDLLPAALAGAPAGASVVLTDLSSALRTLLVAAVNVPGEGHETIVLPRRRT